MYLLFMALYIASAACFFLVAIDVYWRKTVNGVAAGPKVNLLALGLLLWVLVPLIQLART